MASGADIVLLFDGIVEPKNPGGHGAWGFVIYIGTKTKIAECGCLGNPEWMTNNYAEYCALGFALRKLIELDLEIRTLTILGDSQLVVNQVNEAWKVKSELLAPLHAKCCEYLRKLNIDSCIRWVPRDVNVEADEMSRKAYRDATGKEPAERH